MAHKQFIKVEEEKLGSMGIEMTEPKQQNVKRPKKVEMDILKIVSHTAAKTEYHIAEYDPW
jgi:hypothetical protein